MKKLRLELDALTVDSFATDGLTREVGTVRGHDVTVVRCSTDCDTDGATCLGGTCDGAYTCNGEHSCPLSCTDCGTYYCASGDPSCTQPSCVYTCNVSCGCTDTCP